MARRSQYEIWAETFRPIKNPRKHPASGDTTRFEAMGEDLDQVLAASRNAPETVWTLLSGENGSLHIAQGYHLVNRQAYYLTAVPFDPVNPEHVRRYQHRDVAY
ncbi:hypothetical protein AB4Y45_34040 [Paraburkholderia sp. EG287A]|uniref:hypothetical protein n=1 Tax=Paraburkholderia sp. EG287A TaxID=3237012 RepID=UPI0034D18DDC